MAQSQIHMVEMETHLSADKDGSYRDSVCAAIDGELAELKQQIDAGLPPEEFEQAERLRESLQRAKGVVQFVWKLQHDGPQT